MEDAVLKNFPLTLLGQQNFSDSFQVVFINGCVYEPLSTLLNGEGQKESKSIQRTEQGIEICVDQNTPFTSPLTFWHMELEENNNNESDDDNNTVPSPRKWHHRIHLKANSHLQLNLVYWGVEDSSHSYEHHSLLEITQEPSSVLKLIHYQNDSSSAQHRSELICRLEKEAQLHALSLQMGGEKSFQSWKVHVLGKDTQIRLDGVVLGKAQQHHQWETSIEHHEGAGESHQLLRNISTDQARVHFKGHICIHPGAQKVSASQLSQSLLLSPQAEIETQPILDIHADDVKASHGASIGQLDAEQIFYLCSRGVPLIQAKNLLTEGFISKVLNLHLPFPLSKPSQAQQDLHPFYQFLKTQLKEQGKKIWGLLLNEKEGDT